MNANFIAGTLRSRWCIGLGGRRGCRSVVHWNVIGQLLWSSLCCALSVLLCLLFCFLSRYCCFLWAPRSFRLAIFCLATRFCNSFIPMISWSCLSFCWRIEAWSLQSLLMCLPLGWIWQSCIRDWFGNWHFGVGRIVCRCWCVSSIRVEDFWFWSALRCSATMFWREECRLSCLFHLSYRDYLVGPLQQSECCNTGLDTWPVSPFLWSVASREALSLVQCYWADNIWKQVHWEQWRTHEVEECHSCDFNLQFIHRFLSVLSSFHLKLNTIEQRVSIIYWSIILLNKPLEGIGLNVREMHLKKYCKKYAHNAYLL